MVEGKTEIFSRKKFGEIKEIFINMPFQIEFVGGWVSAFMFVKKFLWV